MNIQDGLDNLKKTDEWNLICNSENIELIMLNTKNCNTFSKFILQLFQLNNMKCSDTKLIQKTILIHRFPDIFMSSNMSEYEENLYTRSTEIFELFISGGVINFRILFKKLLTISIMYADWEVKDKNMQIKILCETFNSYNIFKKEIRQQNSVSNEDKDTYIECIQQFLNKVLHALKFLESDWKNKLANYTFKSVEYTETSHKNMVKYFKSIFWENIYIEIIVKKNYKICNYLINDYMELLNQDLADGTALENYKCVESLNDIYDLQSIMVSINRRVDSDYNYDFLFSQNSIVHNFQKIFNRLEKFKPTRT